MKKLGILIAMVMVATMISACGVSLDTVKYCEGAYDWNPINNESCEFCDIAEIIRFDWDSDLIRSDQIAKIDKVSNLMKKYHDTDLTIAGWASIEGGEDYNMDLSKRRANALKNALMERGIPVSRKLMVSGE